MTNKSIIFFLGLCPIIPVLVHLADGLLFIAEFWFLFAAGILTRGIIRFLNIAKIQHIVEYLCIIAAAALYGEITGIFFPVIMIGLHAYIYIFAFSYILIISIAQYYENTDPLEFPLFYSLLLLTIAVLRELFVFGTLSLPYTTGFIGFKIIPFTLPLKFWGSSAGILILLGVGLWLYRSFQKGELLPFKTDECLKH